VAKQRWTSPRRIGPLRPVQPQAFLRGRYAHSIRGLGAAVLAAGEACAIGQRLRSDSPYPAVIACSGAAPGLGSVGAGSTGKVITMTATCWLIDKPKRAAGCCRRGGYLGEHTLCALLERAFGGRVQGSSRPLHSPRRFTSGLWSARAASPPGLAQCQLRKKRSGLLPQFIAPDQAGG